MIRSTDIEQVFLELLCDKYGRDKIIKNTGHFDNNHWHRLIGLSIQYALFPPLYNRLLSLKLENIPPEAAGKLKNLYLINLKKNIILEQELFRVIKHLNQSDIRVIPLKGPALARLLYNDLALRQTSFDLDILVNSNDLAEAEKGLRALGYFNAYSQNKINSFYTYNWAVRFQRNYSEDGSIILEAHWAFRQGFIGSNIEQFRLNARYANLDGQKILIPSPEDLLLYLALISICGDHFIEIKYLYDIHNLTVKFGRDLDWQGLIKQAKQVNLGTLLFFALKLCQDFFGTDLPEDAVDNLRPGFIKENLFKLWVNKHTVFNKHTASCYTWDFFILPYFYAKNIPDYLRIIYRKIFKPMNIVMEQYEKPMSKVSYFLYLKRLLKPFYLCH